jgi:serine/threonine protein kinase
LERNEAMEYVDPEKIFFNFVLNGQKYFVKGLKKNRNFRFSLVYEEISLAEKYIHPNLMRTFTFYEDDIYVYIVSEMFGQDLESFQTLMKNNIDDVLIKKIFRQIVEGMNFLHKNNVIH